MSLNYNVRYFEDFADGFSNVLDKKMMKAFFNETEKDNQLALINSIESKNLKLGMHKINLFSVAAMMGNTQALEVAGTRYDMWIGLDNQTLIEICNKTEDIDSIQICIEKINQSDGSNQLNWQTLGLIIKSDQTEQVREMLTNHQLRPAEFSNKE